MEKCVFFMQHIHELFTPETEHHAYMVKTPILYMKILRNFVCFFKGGFD